MRLVWFLLFLLFLAAVWKWVRHRRLRMSSESSRPHLIDAKALSEAEQEVASWQGQSEWKVLATYDSSRGYNENDLMDIVAYLGSFNIASTFDKGGVGLEGGALLTFVLRVPPEQFEYAKKVLKEK